MDVLIREMGDFKSPWTEVIKHQYTNGTTDKLKTISRLMHLGYTHQQAITIVKDWKKE